MRLWSDETREIDKSFWLQKFLRFFDQIEKKFLKSLKKCNFILLGGWWEVGPEWQPVPNGIKLLQNFLRS